MIFLRRLLLSFSLIYFIVTALRNLFYNTGIFKSAVYNIPIIAIGNLSTGGTGKTPQTEYLIRLLQNRYKLATLSRGYKRKSQGFVLANAFSNAESLGDEPYQFYCKFPNITVAVDADRRNGIEKLLELNPKPEVILLDDAFQHRRVKAGFYILLTAYNDLYADDFLLPAGNLRESRAGAKRADIIIVTKCPEELSQKRQEGIIKKLKPKAKQKVYFTSVKYDDNVYNGQESIPVDEIKKTKKLLVAGIAKPTSFYNYLKQPEDVLLTYPDHHDFSEKDIADIKARASGNMIITTEKDYVRLKDKMSEMSANLYYLPIKTNFINGVEDFDVTILKYAERA